jgi:hypothetical protein
MSVAEVLPLPGSRRDRLKELEGVIASGWAEVVRVGQALREIRDEGLYLELGDGITFEHYCKSRWSLPESSAYRKIDAAKIHEATSQILGGIPITTEWVGLELAPLLRSGGPEAVAEAWAKVSDRYQGQRPPTAREVHRVLVEEGYRPKVGQVSGGKLNTGILLGQVGEKIAATEKRLDWFLNHDLDGNPKVAKSTRTLALSHAERLEAMAVILREFSEGTR